MMYDVIIVGAGLAGCSAAIQLADRGWKVLLLEQQRYPIHKLCGEFLSVEVIASFAQLGILEAVRQVGAHPIRRTLLTSPLGATFEHELPGVALGLSRYQLDLMLFERAITVGAVCQDGTVVRGIAGDLTTGFRVATSQGNFTSRMVLAAYGKRSPLDTQFDRPFARHKSPWVAFKVHCHGLAMPGVIELHGFAGGYCGLSMIETGAVNLCWIGHEKILRGSVDRNLPDALFSNPLLHDRLQNLHCEPVGRKRLSQISFARKGNFDGDICMIGDTAGMITPLCGDGMAMALRTAEIVVPLASDYLEGTCSASHFKQQYSHTWHQEFNFRLQLGRVMHAGFIQPQLAQASVVFCQTFPAVGNWLIRNTRDYRMVTPQAMPVA
jgi:flavin-dependent dehydrogenase